jgi:hypothetical protein
MRTTATHRAAREKINRIYGLVTLVSLDAGMPCLAGGSHLTDRGHDDDTDRPTGIFVLAHWMGQRIRDRIGGRSIWRVQEGAIFLDTFHEALRQAFVNQENPASLGVMSKTGMAKRGVMKGLGKLFSLLGNG